MVEKQQQGKLIVFSAPSGTGKSTIANIVLERLPHLKFSVSATTRQKREGEQEGVNYYFLCQEEFEQTIQSGGFIEYEFFFGNYYGTLFDKTYQAIHEGRDMLLDLDVKGALNLKKLFPANSLLIFIQPPSMEVLQERLKSRKSEDENSLNIRLQRAQSEIEYASQFDEVVVNDTLHDAVDAVMAIITRFLSIT